MALPQTRFATPESLQRMKGTAVNLLPSVISWHKAKHQQIISGITAAESQAGHDSNSL